VTQDHVPFCKAIGNSVHVWGGGQNLQMKKILMVARTKWSISDVVNPTLIFL